MSSVVPQTGRPGIDSLTRRAFGRSPFAAITDVDAELRQLGTIRIVTGLLCLTRLAPSIWASRYYFEDGLWGVPQITFNGIGVLALIALVTAGVLTPLTTVALLFAARWYDVQLGSESLSTELLSLLLTLLAVTSAGARRSIDAVLLRSTGVAGRAVRALYTLTGIPSTDGMRAVLIVFFVALAVINLGGVVHHWEEEEWRSGRALQIIFSSSYMSRVWQPWRSFEIYWPDAAVWTSWILTMTQLVMQTAMLALVWWPRTAWLVILWGAGFFVASILALQLHYLGAFELLIWIALFHRPRGPAPQVAREFTRRPWAERTFVRAAAAVLVIFVAHEVWAAAGIRPYPFPRLRQALAVVGMQSPRVFNQNDLPLGDAWTVAYYGRDEELPYHGRRGERLAWTRWNELLLYRSSVRWRNEYRPETFLDHDRDPVRRLAQLTLFDHRRRHAQVSVYVIDYYTSKASHTELSPAERFREQFAGSTWFRCSGERNAASCTAVEFEALTSKPKP